MSTILTFPLKAHISKTATLQKMNKDSYWLHFLLVKYL